MEIVKQGINDIISFILFFKNSLILCISPSAYNRQETIYTLAFGERAMTIALNLYSNEEVDYKALYLMTQKKLDESNDEIIKQKILIEKLRNELKEVKDELDSSNYNNKVYISLYILIVIDVERTIE